MLSTGTLNHGGIMVNYQCSAACRHCLYSCSPTRKPGYVDEKSAGEICRLLRSGGCRSVHIGGGEPFLNFDGLLMMVRKLKEAGIRLEYTETNAFWAADTSENSRNEEKLKKLFAEGANCYCISVDPYHAEYVPYGAALNLAELCEKTGVDYFLWKQEYLRALSKLDSEKTHSREDMEKTMSKKYIFDTARHYGIGFGGRAVNIEDEFGSAISADRLVEDSSPCRNLLSTGHFHVDKDCYFIPPRCTGIRIPLSEAVSGIPSGKYPVFEALYNGGISALLDFARQQGFSEKAGYPSKCNLCFHVRQFLSKKGFPELDEDHYDEALKYY